MRLRPAAWCSGLVAVVVSAWILATPPSGGPDEPSHLVRGAALVRGQLDGEVVRDDIGTARRFDVPVWVGWPDPVCFAMYEYTPATCATSLPRPDDLDDLADLPERPTSQAPQTTRAYDYPIWGHLLPGLGTFAPASASLQLSRLLSALIPIALVGAALTLAARAGPLRVGSVLLAVTPTAWFTFGIVNPSAMVIAGGAALWVAATDRTAAPWASWIAAAGWAALVLPRRDGLIWGCLALVAISLLDRRSILAWLRGLGRGPLAVIAVSTAAVLAWGITSDARVSRMVVLVPVVVVAADVVRWVWDRFPHSSARAAVGVASIATAGLAAAVVVARRPGGWDERLVNEPSVPLFREIVRRSHQHVTEAIGELGWLDAPLPPLALALWWTGLGVLVAAVIERGHIRRVAIAGAIGLTAVVVPWVLEMYQGNDTGTYWQGRYSLPLLMGVPIVLGAVRREAPDVDEARERRLGILLGTVAVVVLNAAMYTSMRRWGVGQAGSFLPTRWDTYHAPIPPVVVLFAHAAASVGLAHRALAMARR